MSGVVSQRVIIVRLLPSNEYQEILYFIIVILMVYQRIILRFCVWVNEVIHSQSDFVKIFCLLRFTFGFRIKNLIHWWFPEASSERAKPLLIIQVGLYSILCTSCYWVQRSYTFKNKKGTLLWRLFRGRYFTGVFYIHFNHV